MLRSPVSLPKDLIPSLLDRFASNQAYQLYNDVIPFFQTLRQFRKEHHRSLVGRGCDEDVPLLQLGIITNSDDRVPSILSSLGLQVCPRRHGSSKEAEDVHWRDFDFDWVIMSYDTGTEKPDRSIFDVARGMSNSKGDDNTLFLHVGNDLDEDYWGSHLAGWQSILLSREEKNNEVHGIDQVTSLNSLQQRLFGET